MLFQYHSHVDEDQHLLQEASKVTFFNHHRHYPETTLIPIVYPFSNYPKGIYRICFCDHSFPLRCCPPFVWIISLASNVHRWVRLTNKGLCSARRMKPSFPYARGGGQTLHGLQELVPFVHPVIEVEVADPELNSPEINITALDCERAAGMDWNVPREVEVEWEWLKKCED